MFMQRRRLGEWLQLTDREGRVLMLRVDDIRPGLDGRPPEVTLAFLDDALDFKIRRPEADDPDTPYTRTAQLKLQNPRRALPANPGGPLCEES